MIDVKRANVLFIDGKTDKAVEMYYEGALLGDAECAFNYAYCLLRGKGTAKDAAAAKSFFTYAVNSVPEAAYNLAVMYLDGVGCKKDYKRAMEYMHDAARAGVIEAQLYLGVAHTVGLVFEPDVEVISKIPYHIPEYRDRSVMLEGEIEENPVDEENKLRAVYSDPTSAFEWFRAAARHSTDYVEDLARTGKYLYARCFIDGLGTDFNRDRGNALMLLAAKEGSEEAAYYITTEAPYMLEKLGDSEYIESVRKIERLG